MADLQFPWEAFMQAQDNKNKNKQQLAQLLGQTLGNIGQDVGQGIQNHKLQQQQQQQKQQVAGLRGSINQMAQPQPQTMNVAGQQNVPIASYDPNSNQTTPTMKPQDPRMQQMLAMIGKLPDQQLPQAAVNLSQQMAKSSFSQPKATGYLGSTNLKNATPEQLNMAQSLLNGDIRPSDLSYRDKGQIVLLANELAKQKGVPFQSYGGDVKRGMSENLAYGKLGQNALSLNTAIGHAKSALDAYQSVQNTNSNFLNKPINAIRRSSNDPNIIKLDTSLTALRGELSSVFKGSSGTDQEIGHWLGILNSNLTPVQAQAAIVQVNDLLNSRIQAIKYQQHDVMDQSPSQRTLISPKSQAVQKSLGNNGAKATLRWNPQTNSLEPVQ